MGLCSDVAASYSLALHYSVATCGLTAFVFLLRAVNDQPPRRVHSVPVLAMRLELQGQGSSQKLFWEKSRPGISRLRVKAEPHILGSCHLDWIEKNVSG